MNDISLYQIILFRLWGIQNS